MAELKDFDPNVAEPDARVDEPPKKTVDAEEGIEGLKKQLEAERGRREVAEREAREASVRVYNANAEVDDTNLQLISNAIETIKGHTVSLKHAYASAMSAGDYNKAADLQLELSGDAAKLLQLETGRQAMAERPKTNAPSADPVEELAGRLTPRSAAWVRAHPECAKDPRMFRKMLRAHEDAIDDGISADTDEYFASVEARLGFRGRNTRENDDDDGDEGTEMAAQPVARRSSPAAAPVSRSAPTSSGNSRSVRLSADERDMARMNKMTDEQYYEQKQRIARDTRMN